MTFDELTQLAVAIRATKIEYDSHSETLDMVIVPEYGIKEAVKGKMYKFHFVDCVYFENVIVSKELFFISWGKLHNNIGEEIIEKSSEKSLRKSFTGPILQELITNEAYESFFFENDLGNAMRIVCKKISVEETK